MSVPRSLFGLRVLVDSSAFYALADRASNVHSSSLAVQSHLIQQRRHLFTTNYIVAETHSLILNRLGRDTAARVLHSIDDSAMALIRVSAADELRAREIIFAHDDKTYSLTDATSFAVMERVHISTAFAFDRHFVQYGFSVLGLDHG